MNQCLDKKDIYKEIFCVLAHFNNDVIQKIPTPLFRQVVDLAADSEIDVLIDMDKTIEEQNISEESKAILSLIYYKYIADVDEQNELIMLWKNND